MFTRNQFHLDLNCFSALWKTASPRLPCSETGSKTKILNLRFRDLCGNHTLWPVVWLFFTQPQRQILWPSSDGPSTIIWPSSDHHLTVLWPSSLCDSEGQCHIFVYIHLPPADRPVVWIDPINVIFCQRHFSNIYSGGRFPPLNLSLL